jgi:hypothetical protein
VAYAYDPVGNGTSVSTSVGKTNTVIPYLANNCNQYTQVGSLLVSSDRNGNLTSDQKGNSYTRPYKVSLPTGSKGISWANKRLYKFILIRL